MNEKESYEVYIKTTIIFGYINLFGQYFGDFGGSGLNLHDYYCCNI